MKRAILLVTLVLVVASCKQVATIQEKSMSFSEKVMKDVMPAMMATVQAKVNEQGFASAVKFCNVFATEFGKEKNKQWANEAKTELGATSFKFRRISLKTRNPQNVPTERQKQILTVWQNENLAHPTGYLQEGVITTMFPIRVTSPTCLGCHGGDKSIDAEALKEIQKLYPNDAATGYVLDELRGAFVTEIVLSQN